MFTSSRKCKYRQLFGENYLISIMCMRLPNNLYYVSLEFHFLKSPNCNCDAFFEQPLLMNKLNEQFSLLRICILLLHTKPCMLVLFILPNVIVLSLMWNSTYI